MFYLNPTSLVLFYIYGPRFAREGRLRRRALREGPPSAGRGFAKARLRRGRASGRPPSAGGGPLPRAARPSARSGALRAQRGLVLRLAGIHLINPTEDPTLKIPDVLEANRTQESGCL